MLRLGRETSCLVPGWVGCVGLMLVLTTAGCGGERKGNAASSREASGTASAEFEKAANSEIAAVPTPAASSTPAPAAAAPQAASQPAPALASQLATGPTGQAATGPTGQAATATKPATPAASAAASEPPEAQEPPLPPLTPVADRKPAPAFTATDMAGREIGLVGLKGKVSLVVFWATWCRPCMMEIPELVRLQQAYGSKGLTVLGLSVDRRGLAVVKPFLEKHPEINYPIVPSGLAAADAFGGVTSIPMSFLIDREGRIIRSFVGLMPGEVLEGYVKAALQEEGAS
jgi:thiol-disulfide isomerase/thioredoxin